jgi:hypothetical protein
MGSPCPEGASGYIPRQDGDDKVTTMSDGGAEEFPIDPDLPPAAQRALAEAAERRRAAKALAWPPEIGGRDGPEPVRYGDWEKKGIAVDF